MLAALSLASTFGVLEGGLRLRLRAEKVAALPHVGLGTEAGDRLRWERHMRGGEDRFKVQAPDPLLGWRLRPHVRVVRASPSGAHVEVTTNGAGLRGAAEVALRKPPGTVRVAIFGCSQTFGAGVTDGEAYPAQLAALMPGVEVLNFGVGGYGTDQMVLSWESAGARFEPDVVVLAFAWYHIERNVRSFRFYAKPRFTLGADGELRLVGVPVPPPEAVLADGPLEAPHALADRSVLLRWTWAKILRRQGAQLYRPDAPAWQLTGALIARFAAIARQTSARMLLMSIEPGPPAIIAALAALADELGVSYLDVTPLQRAARAQRVRLRLPHDAHWSPEGHRLLAEALRAWLSGAETEDA